MVYINYIITKFKLQFTKKYVVALVPDIMWEFKWNKDDPKINGPHTTEQMNQWSNSDYFKGDVWVRKFGEVGEFHTSKRIDFEIFL